MTIHIKRVYELPQPTDGKRILIDRLWPRGLTKEKAKIDIWIKDIAPSTTLRKWFGHDPDKWPKFKKLYQEELQKNQEIVLKIVDLFKISKVTLVYGAKDEVHNDAIALKEYIEKKYL